ncbi:MAG: efflux RND transporter periplasmic adaptor subunit [Oscillospiraceae bacterium]|nr:efflux RND transporter periplasmic adaptor subunit [Oscillospiraceae bacterium]
MEKTQSQRGVKIIILAIVLTAALILALAACHFVRADGNDAANDAADEPTTERLIAVNIEPVQTGSIRTELSFTGQVRASAQIAVMSRLQGTVDEVMVNVGDFVNAGDVLFTMDQADIQTNIRAINAQLETADAAVNAARTGVALAGGSAVQAQILQAETAMLQAQAGVQQAELAIEQRILAILQAEIARDDAAANLENMTLLLEFGDISQAQFDQAQSGATNAAIMLEQALSALEMAEASFEQARNGVTQANESYRIISENVRAENQRRAQDGLAQAQAQRESLVVNLEAAEERLGDAVITAPISGVISSRGVEPRAMLLPNVAPFTIVSIDTVLVHVNVTETIVNRIQNGQQVRANISAAADTPLIGEVVTVSPTADPMTQTFSVEIEMDNRAGLLRPGMFAEAFFVRDEAENTLVIPRSAVILDDGSTIVYLAIDQQAVRREVTVGIDSGAEIEILSGITAGDMLIVRGQTFVRDGSPIHIVESGGE